MSKCPQGTLLAGKWQSQTRCQIFSLMFQCFFSTTAVDETGKWSTSKTFHDNESYLLQITLLKKMIFKYDEESGK
jgi:hypothetical protein